MVICKYFIRGTCRFGENCKNEHSYNDTSGSVMKKKQEVDPNIIIKSVSNDMDKAENGHQWPFSCYGPFQGKPCFPGFEDKSFEEFRFGLYDAEKSGRTEQYKQQFNELLSEIRLRMRSLQNPTTEAINLLKELFNSNTSESSTTSTFTNNSTSIFGNQPTNQPSVFGNSQNIFSNQPVSTAANNFSFTSAVNNQINAGSIFNQNNQPGFSSNSIFGGGKSVFNNTQQNFPSNANIFQTNPPPNQTLSTNTGNLFATSQNNQLFTQQQATGGSIFVQSSPFTQNNTAEQPNPFKQNTVDPFKQNAADPFKQNTVDPFKQNAADPFKQNAVDPFKQNAAVPFKQNTVDPFKQNTVDPFKQNAVDPFKQNIADPFKQNTTEPLQQNTGNPFQQNTTDPFKQNIFQQSQPSVGNQLPFANTSTFGQNSVLHAPNQGTTNNLAEHTKSIFGTMQSNAAFQTQLDTRRQDDTTIYSKLEDLSETEIKCFEAVVFEFGKIPVNPPTLQMC